MLMSKATQLVECYESRSYAISKINLTQSVEEY